MEYPTDTQDPRHVTPRYGAPDVATLHSSAVALAPLGPRTIDGFQTHANNFYSGSFPVAALHAERLALIDVASRAKGSDKESIVRLFDEISSCQLPPRQLLECVQVRPLDDGYSLR